MYFNVNVSIVKSMAYLLNEIARHFVNLPLYSILIVCDTSFHKSSLSEYYEDGIEEAFRELNSNHLFVLQSIQIDLSDADVQSNNSNSLHLLHQHVELGVQAYIVISSNLNNFLNLKHKIQQTSTQRIRDKRFLFLSDNIDVNELFKHRAFNLYPHHLLVVPSNNLNHSLDLFTQKFIGVKDYQQPMLLDSFNLINSTFKNYVDLYPDKLANLQGRILNVSTVTYVPYSYTERVAAGAGSFNEWNSTDEKTIFFDGTEVRILINFCLLRNCTIILRLFRVSVWSKNELIVPGDFWGTIEANGTASGQVGAVYLGQVDFAIGCLYKWFFDIFDTSSPIAKSGITLLVPAPRHLSYVLTPILPFDALTWMYFFISIILCIILFYFVKVFSELLKLNKVFNYRSLIIERRHLKTSIRKTALQIVSTFLQQGFKLGSSKIAVRMVYAVLLFAAITLENAYSGGLKSILTIPKLVDKIQTIHDFVERKIPWGAPQPAWVLSMKEAQTTDIKYIYKDFELQSDDYFRNMSFSRKYGLGIERLHGGSYSFNDYIKYDALQYLDVLQEDLYYEYTHAISIRGWPLMEKFNDVALQTLQHGLFHRWETEIVDKYLDLLTEERLRQMGGGYEEAETPKNLKFEHITGPLFMLAVGVFFATITFIGEHIHHMYKRKKRKYVERK